ncbi:MAG: SRPBCC family protein [Euryarchaeota archaeon]|nr:SRPBCC family protein [Euryarchaeota archaeon]
MQLVAHSAECSAPPDKAAAVILDPKNLGKWFTGVTDVTADPTWPAVGSKMRWRVGGSWFEARVDVNELPHRLVHDTKTPSGRSVVAHLFEETEVGGTNYTKTVDVIESKGLFGLILPFFLPGAVRGEVERAAKLADGKGR